MTGFDTNILVYSCDESDPRRQQTAHQLLRRITDGVILWQAACEFLSASRKLEGFTAGDAWKRLAELLEAFPLVTPTPGVLQRARSLHLEFHWSYWDALIVGACLDAGVTRLYSEDLPGSRPPKGLEIVNPFA